MWVTSLAGIGGPKSELKPWYISDWNLLNFWKNLPYCRIAMEQSLGHINQPKIWKSSYLAWDRNRNLDRIAISISFTITSIFSDFPMEPNSNWSTTFMTMICCWENPKTNRSGSKYSYRNGFFSWFIWLDSKFAWIWFWSFFPILDEFISKTTSKCSKWLSKTQ